MKYVKNIILVFLINLLFSLSLFGADSSYHTIVKGDSLMTISFQYYGTHQRWQEIQAANPNIDPKMLVPGEQLIVPNPKKVVKQSPADSIKPINEAIKKKSSNRSVAADIPIELPKKEEPKVKETIEQKEEVFTVNKEEYEKLRNFDKLQRAYDKLKAENNKLKEEVIALNHVKDQNKKLSQRVFESKSNVADDFAKELQTYAHLTEVQSRILQEKHRVLSQRLWVLNNDRVDRCEIQVNASDPNPDQTFLSFIEFLNREVGSENVFVKPEANQVVVNFPGNIVYGVYNPSVHTNAYESLVQMSEYIERLGIPKLEIAGHSRFERVYNKEKDSRSGFAFMMDQSLALQDFFIEKMGLSPKKLSVTSFGASRQLRESETDKRFELTFSLQSNSPTQARSIASIDNDVGYHGLIQETLEYIGEPKYAKAEITEDGFELHLARSYFWTNNESELNRVGKQKMARIMQILSRAEDVSYQFYWVPGVEEANEGLNRRIALSQLESLRSYLENDLLVPPAVIEMGYKNRMHMLRFPASSEEDRFNSRLIIRVKPISISARTFR